MASNSLSRAQSSSIPMSYSRNSNGASFSQSHMGSFNASSQSVNSTPAPTPPPPRGSQQNLSVGFPNKTVNHGPMQRNSFGGFDGSNGYGTLVPYQGQYRPQIYTAVYSNVSVYEMEVNGVAVMRRRSDSWLNATQILKVAGVVKARRTKTLEKEIAAGEHEKVQGGYGKYQGTWVNYQRGLELCRHYGVEELLRDLLEYDMGQDGQSQAGQGHIDTPTKEQAMAAQRKRLYRSMDGNGMNQSAQGTYFRNLSPATATAVSAINKARFDSSMSRNPDARRPSNVRLSSQTNSQESQFPASQQSVNSLHSDSGFASNMQSQRSNFELNDEAMEPPRKRRRSMSAQQQQRSFQSMEPTPTEPSDSFCQPDAAFGPGDGARGLNPLPEATTSDRFQKMKLVMTLFLDKRVKDFSNHPAFLNLTSEDLETPLDEYYNTALHWAAMLARMPLVHALIAKGVSIYRLNAAGETALQKAVGTRNNYDYRSFGKLLQVLYPTIEIIDRHGRTVLHHIAMMAATGGGGHVAAKHYLESLLEFIVRHGGTSSSQDSALQNNSAGGGHQTTEVIGLGKFMSEMVNVQDDQGDTALNLAGRARTVLVPQLLEVGASPYVPNHTGLRPADYGVGVDMVNGSSQQNGEKISLASQLIKTKKEIFEATLSQVAAAVEHSLEALDKGLSAGLGKKQDEFDQWHAKIRESAKARQIEQTQLDEMKRKARERIELDRQIKNLERSHAEISASLKELASGDVDLSQTLSAGDADKALGFDASQFTSLFPENFDPVSGFSEAQISFLIRLPSIQLLKTRVKCYNDHNNELLAEVERLKTKNVVLGQNYRRMVMACTGWSEEQVDEAAEGLTECIKDLNENPVPEDVAIEILMRDRGQDW